MSLERQLADYGRLQEQLFGPIGVDEVTDPVVDKRGRGDLATQGPSVARQPRRNRGPAWALAAFAVVLAVGALYVVFLSDGDQVADNPPPTTVAPDMETMTDLEVIQAGVEALYSGDAERAVELFEIEDGDDEAQIRDDDLIRREAAYQAVIGGRLTVNCTDEVNTPGMFTCNVPYHNALTDAVGYVDSPGDPIHVVVQDGVITQFGLPHHLDQGVAHEFPEHSFLLWEVGYFLREEVEGSEGCLDDLRTPECARLIMDHLDEWAAWCGQLVRTAPLTCENRT